MLSHVPSAGELAVVEAVVVGLRGVVAVLGAYLVVSAAASLVVHGLRLRKLAPAVDAVTLPPVRRLVRAAVGVSVAAGTFVGTTGVSAGSTESPVPVMRRLGDSVERAEHAEHRPAAAPPPVEPAAAAAEWTVRPGDHFWRIAEEALATQLHRAPSDSETDPYWRRLVTANRDRLADRDNPDLLFPGQVLLLPASTGT